MAKTVINDRNLYEKRNKDDIFIRDVIGGLLKLLNNRLKFKQIWEDSSLGEEEVTIPFYFELGEPTSERFLQDNYITFGSQCGFKQINGNFDMIPRGMVSLESANIAADSVTNRFVMGEYQKEDPNDGKIKTYVSLLYAIPMDLTFGVEIRSSSFTEMLKITEACNEFFYKNKTYYINHKGMKLGCRCGFPESFLGEKQSGYTMGGSDATDKINKKQTFELKVECYQPVFDKSTERLKSNVVRKWTSSIDVYNSVREIMESSGEVVVRKQVTPSDFFFTAPYYFDQVYRTGSKEYEEEYLYPLGLKYTNIEKEHKVESPLNLMCLVDDYQGMKLFPSNSIIPFHWTSRKQFGDINYVTVEFLEDSENFKNENFGIKDASSTIIDVIDNHMEYEWYIPKEFTGFDGTDLMLFNDDFVTVYKEPVIRVVPDPSTGKITKDSIFCLDAGQFIVNVNGDNWDLKEKNEHGGFSYYTHISAELSYKNKKGVFEQMMINIPIKDGVVETCGTNGMFINFDRVMERPIDIDYTAKFNYRKGKLLIYDSNNKNFKVSVNMTIV